MAVSLVTWPKGGRFGPSRLALGLALWSLLMGAGHGDTSGVDAIRSEVQPTAMSDPSVGADRPPTYSTRQPLAAFPWGEGPGQVPYGRSDMGRLVPTSRHQSIAG